VLAFNMVHALVMLAVGFVASWLVALSEKYPLSQYAVLVALIFVGFHLFAAVLLFAMPLLGALGWVPLAISSAAAAVAMGWYLLRIHPALRAELKNIPMGTVPPGV
jgi:predicted tellurium resistance membrane protein TerC